MGILPPTTSHISSQLAVNLIQLEALPSLELFLDLTKDRRLRVEAVHEKYMLSQE